MTVDHTPVVLLIVPLEATCEVTVPVESVVVIRNAGSTALLPLLRKSYSRLFITIPRTLENKQPQAAGVEELESLESMIAILCAL